jgi:DNA-binding transcriptional MerR regulator
MRELSEFEEHLVELIHFLAFGSKKQKGLTIREVKQFLNTPIKDRQNMTPIELIAKDGREFINELKTYLNELEDHLD